MLSPAAAEEVSDLLSGPPSTPPYSNLKAALLERTTASQQSRIKQLLSTEELGDHQLSQLPRMRQSMSGNTTTTDDNLQRLLAKMQMVLATASMLDLNCLASLADRSLESSDTIYVHHHAVVQQRECSSIKIICYCFLH